LVRATRIPEKCAASAFAPIAYTERPNGVACRTTPKTSASGTIRMSTLGTGPSPMVPVTQPV
jgi:hypothetical protein